MAQLASSATLMPTPHPPQAADESVLTPRFYTTDFDEMEQLFSLELNPNLPMEELEVRSVATLTRCADAAPFRPPAAVNMCRRGQA